MRTRHTVLALDPGLRDLGYAVLSPSRFLASGVLSLRRLPREQRLPEVRRQVRGWLEAHQPRTIIVEKTYRHPLPWLDALHAITVYIRRLSKRRHLHFATSAPQQVRKTVLGNGRGTKREVAAVIAARYPSLRVYLTQDRRWKEVYWQNMFDALALALHHQAQRKPPSRSR